MQKAARWANIHRQTHYDWLANDPSYPARFKEAQERAARTLEDEAVRRAHEGVHRPVLHRGKQVYVGGEPLFEIHYSDRLLIRLLEAYNPEKFGRRTEQIPWSGDFDDLTPPQLEKVMDALLRQAYGDDPVAIEAARNQLMIEAGATVIDAEATPV